ncbi:MAG: crossover junction endodeoxyribonuclease RuvC, partial [Acidobacteria bacterium]|nr:crossover junction endodeoxyribonuclease RuvC [Acidobacteriota bacterium]
MRILGIDCAVARTGYGVLEEKSGRSPSLVACGVIVTSAKDTFPQRLQRIYNRIQKVVEEFAPDQVALEDIFYYRNFRTAVKLGHVR